MKNKYIFTAVLLSVLTLASIAVIAPSMAAGGEENKKEFTIVSSFYPIYIAALNVTEGCPDVRLVNLSAPQTGCLHDFQLSPGDLRLLSQANVLLVNGGGMEAFLEKAAAVNPALVIIDTGQGILEANPDMEDNAHFWMSMSCYRQQVAAMADGLSWADMAHRDIYERNAAAYEDKIDELIRLKELFREELSGRNAILFHEAYGWLAKDLGLNIVGVLDLDEERPVSAGELSDIIRLMKDREVKILLAEELYGKKFCDMIKAETGISSVYLDVLTRGGADKDAWLKGMRKNMELWNK